jgi:hypothetical protein
MRAEFRFGVEGVAHDLKDEGLAKGKMPYLLSAKVSKFSWRQLHL